MIFQSGHRRKLVEVADAISVVSDVSTDFPEPSSDVPIVEK